MPPHPLPAILDLMTRAHYDHTITTYMLSDLFAPDRRISLPDDCPDDIADALTHELMRLALILDDPDPKLD